MTKRSLVLAGGGVAGIAWETGVLVGIGDVAPEALAVILDAQTTLIGTSAGSTVAAQLATGVPLDDLYAAQLAEQTAELAVKLDLAEFGAMMAGAVAGVTSPEEARRRIGGIARAADTVEPSVRRAVIAARLPVHTWPVRRLLITAIDIDSGDLRVFDASSGVGLVDAVAASCAVPGIWPTVAIDGHDYMDGGMRSIVNADLAAGSDQVLIVVPGPAESPAGGVTIPAAELAALAPATVMPVFADSGSLAAFGLNPLDPTVRRPAAQAGRERGRQVGADVAAFWGGK